MISFESWKREPAYSSVVRREQGPQLEVGRAAERRSRESEVFTSNLKQQNTGREERRETREGERKKEREKEK